MLSKCKVHIPQNKLLSSTHYIIYCRISHWDERRFAHLKISTVQSTADWLETWLLTHFWACMFSLRIEMQSKSTRLVKHWQLHLTSKQILWFIYLKIQKLYISQSCCFGKSRCLTPERNQRSKSHMVVSFTYWLINLHSAHFFMTTNQESSDLECLSCPELPLPASPAPHSQNHHLYEEQNVLHQESSRRRLPVVWRRCCWGGLTKRRWGWGRDLPQWEPRAHLHLRGSSNKHQGVFSSRSIIKLSDCVLGWVSQWVKG